MKTLITIFASIAVLCTSWAAEPVAVDEFMRTKDESKRIEMIKRAPAEQRDDLSKRNHHLHLLEKWGGEEGLERMGEIFSAHERGIAAPIALLAAQDQFWTFYISAASETNRVMGMSSDQRSKTVHNLESEQQTLQKREPIIREEVFSLAVTPQALELNSRAKKLNDSILERLSHVSTSPLTKEERDQMDKDVDAIMRDLEKLPKLTPDQIKKERESIANDTSSS